LKNYEIKNIQFFRLAINHKKISSIILIIIVAIIYFAFKSSSTSSVTKYNFSKVEKQNVVESVTGSGQVSALDQVDVTSEVSGTVQYVNVEEGDSVTKGQTLAYVEATDATRAVENAEINVTNAEITYEKALKTYDEQTSATSTSSDLDQALDDGYTAVSNTFVSLPAVIGDVDDIFYTQGNSPYFSDVNVSKLRNTQAVNYKSEAGTSFDAAKKDYEKVFKIYKNTSSNANQEEISALLTQTYDMVKELNLALTKTHNAIDYLGDKINGSIPTELNSDKSTLSSDITKTTNLMSSLTTASNNLETAEESATDAEISLKTAKLNLNEAEDSLTEAKKTLANHSITSPFDGVVSTVSIEADDDISSGTKIANVITNQKEIVISLNEVDTTKIAVGDKATVTFDAIDGLSMQGTVYKIDVSGTVSNNVVSYGVYISFDEEDSRIKAGMTADVSISTESSTDTLAISSSAIYSDSTGSYVLAPSTETSAENTTDSSTLKKVYIETGVSGDEYTEVTSGLAEGDTYVSGTTVEESSSSSSSSLFSMFGQNRNRTSSSSSSTKSSSSSSSSSKSSSSSSSSSGPSGDMGGGMPPQ